MLTILIATLMAISLPIAWLFCELLSDKKYIKCTLGVLAIFSSFGSAWVFSDLNRYNYNAWYGGVTKKLIDATIESLEKGEVKHVVDELKVLQKKFQPTYESDANYNVIVDESVSKIKLSR